MPSPGRSLTRLARSLRPWLASMSSSPEFGLTRMKEPESARVERTAAARMRSSAFWGWSSVRRSRRRRSEKSVGRELMVLSLSCGDPLADFLDQGGERLFGLDLFARLVGEVKGVERGPLFGGDAGGNQV